MTLYAYYRLDYCKILGQASEAIKWAFADNNTLLTFWVFISDSLSPFINLLGLRTVVIKIVVYPNHYVPSL